MGKLATLLGGVVGGIVMLKVPVEGTFLSSLNTVLDVVGIISVVVFSAGLIYNGFRDLFQK